MIRRVSAALAAFAVVASGLTLGAAPASAGATGASIDVSRWAVNTTNAVTLTWTNSTTAVDGLMVRSPWPWGASYPTGGTFTSSPATDTGITPASLTATCPTINATFTISAGTMTGPLKCSYFNQANNYFKGFWLQAATGGTLTVSAGASVTVTIPSGVVTAPSTAQTDTWLVGRWGDGTDPNDIRAYANMAEVATTAYAVDAAGNPIPLITINIDSNGGSCNVTAVTGYQTTWANAPAGNNCAKSGASFVGYNTSADGSGLSIAPGGNLHLTGGNTLYAIYESPRAPGAPTDVVATAEINQIKVSWKAPADTGSFAITNYLAQATPSGKVCITRVSDANMLSCTFDLPATNTKYSFKVQALNGVGWGQVSSESNAVSPYAFRDVSGSRPNVLLGLAGSKVETNGLAPGLGGFAVTPEYKIGGAANWTSESNAARVNADGRFTWSKRFPASANKQKISVRFTYGGDLVSQTLVLSRGARAGSLTAPRNIKVESVPNRIVVTWDAPEFDGGEQITGYTMCAKLGGSSLCRDVSGERRGVFQGLESGNEYTITVAAKTANRTGPVAEAKKKVTPTEASVAIASRRGEEVKIDVAGAGFTANAKFRLELAVAQPGVPTSQWQWEDARQSFTANRDFRTSFIIDLGPVRANEAIAARLVTPEGPVYSKLSRPPR